MASRPNESTLGRFQVTSHDGTMGRQWSLMHVSDPKIKVEALKKAEHSDETIVRLCEIDGKPAQAARLSFAAPILSAREVDGQEQPIGPAKVDNGQLVVDLDPSQLRAFAVTLAAP